MMFLFPYKMASQGAKLFAQALGAKRIKKEGSRFRGAANKTVINWGNGSVTPEIAKCNVLNKPEAVNRTGNKLLAFTDMLANENVNIPEFTADKQEALAWIHDGKVVVCRTVLRGHSGAGIVIASSEEELVDAPLYVQYVKKSQEYRVHMLHGDAFDVQRKARRQDTPDEEVNWQVRNHDNGFIFMRGGVALPDVAIDQARLALEALGLDFGAVDLIYNERQDKYYVLEVNTAPGLTGTTLEKYVEAFDGI